MEKLSNHPTFLFSWVTESGLGRPSMPRDCGFKGMLTFYLAKKLNNLLLHCGSTFLPKEQWDDCSSGTEKLLLGHGINHKIIVYESKLIPSCCGESIGLCFVRRRNLWQILRINKLSGVLAQKIIYRKGVWPCFQVEEGKAASISETTGQDSNATDDDNFVISTH